MITGYLPKPGASSYGLLRRSAHANRNFTAIGRVHGFISPLAERLARLLVRRWIIERDDLGDRDSEPARGTPACVTVSQGRTVVSMDPVFCCPRKERAVVPVEGYLSPSCRAV